MEARSKNLKRYIAPDSAEPFGDWYEQLRDWKARSKILTRLDRVEQGNFGKHEPVGGGVYELKLDYGPGYRIYYGLDGDDVILLGGGTKQRQSVDISKAIERWEDYNA